MNKKGIALISTLIIIVIIMTLISLLFFSINTNFTILKNFKLYVQDFYQADAATKIEDVKILTLNVSNILRPNVLEEGIDTFPASNISYQYRIKYEFYERHISPGTSLNMFNNYYYSVDIDLNNIKIKEFVSKIGVALQ